MKLKNTLLSTAFSLVLVTALLTASLFGEWEPLQRPERLIRDRIMGLRPRQAPGRVVIVAIDEASIQQLGMWPWPPTILAEGLSRLSACGTEAIALAPIFPVPSTHPAKSDLRQLRETLPKSHPLADKLRRIESRLDPDDALIEAVRCGRNMVLPFRLLFRSGRMGAESPPLSGLLRINSLAPPDRIPVLAAAIPLPPALQSFLERLPPETPPPQEVQETYRELAGKAAALGAVNLAVDPDGVVRQAKLLWPYQGRYFPALPLQLALKALGHPLCQTALHPGRPRYGIRVGETAIPTDASFRMPIAYHPPPVGLSRIPFADLITGKVDPASLKGQVAIIGVTASDMTPTYRTPFVDRATPPEIMAAAVDTILRRDFLIRPPWAPLAESAVLLYLLLFLLLVIPRIPLPVGAAILTGFLATCWGGALAAFITGGYGFRLLPPLILCLIGFGAVAFRQTARRLRSETAALNRSLGLSLQAQGLLDMALEKYLQCPAEDKTIRRLLYNLGLDFERKRMADKALLVYDRILKAGGYGDAKRRSRRLRDARAVTGGTTPAAGPGVTLRLSDAEARPTFGRYEILKELGRGAMGTVYLGQDPKINRPVAIKTLGYDSVPAEELEEVKTRFLREAEAAGKLSHPNIVTIFDVGEEHDTAYLAMELLDGHDLTGLCKSGRLLPVAAVLDIMEAVTDALGYAHRAGVVHRDIKPANIMRLKDGRVKVTDFGIAKVRDSGRTRTGIVMGTPSYMSPEQIGGKKLDGRSDLFSLGIVFYEMLSGRKPFGGDDLNGLMVAIAKTPHPPLLIIVPDLPPCCAAVVDKFLSKSVTRRYRTAAQALEAIRRCREAIG